MARAYWLMKSEPDVYSIDDLERDGQEFWEGVRNYQARNFMRAMKKGDLALFYHSNSKPSGVVGVAKIVGEAYPDPTQFDKTSPYFDKKPSKDGTPRWDVVDVAFEEKFESILSLSDLKDCDELTTMHVVQKGSRLSVTPV
ncbi:MAG: EVE domain-containing protein, partial [Myxococcota bacterium]